MRRLDLVGLVAAAGCFTSSPPPAQIGARADEDPEVRACNAGKGEACLELADRYFEGSGDTLRDPEKAAFYYEKACGLRESRACNNLGTAWSEGKNGAPAVDHRKARALYEKACALNNGLGCFNLGNVYRLGEGVEVDLEIALRYFQKSCDLDEAKGCTELAILYYEGTAVPKDFEAAMILLEKGCRLGSQAACQNFDVLKRQGQGP
jgi:TPR repeat protein